MTALAVDPADSDIVYAGTGGGVKKSTDGGHSWRTVLWRGRFMIIGALVIALTSPQVIYAAAMEIEILKDASAYLLARMCSQSDLSAGP